MKIVQLYLEILGEEERDNMLAWIEQIEEIDSSNCDLDETEMRFIGQMIDKITSYGGQARISDKQRRWIHLIWLKKCRNNTKKIRGVPKLKSLYGD